MKKSKSSGRKALAANGLSKNGFREHVSEWAGSFSDLGEAVKDVFIDEITDMLKRVTSRADGDRKQRMSAKGAGARKSARPYAPLLVAAGVAFMLGLVLRRR